MEWFGVEIARLGVPRIAIDATERVLRTGSRISDLARKHDRSGRRGGCDLGRFSPTTQGGVPRGFSRPVRIPTRQPFSREESYGRLINTGTCSSRRTVVAHAPSRSNLAGPRP